MNKKIISCAVALSCVLVVAADSVQPLNPAFQVWQQAQQSGAQRNKPVLGAFGQEPSGGIPPALVPSPVDRSYLVNLHTAKNGHPVQGAGGTSLPRKYDSRTSGWVSAVGNQAPYNTCWAFAPLSCLESWLLKSESTAHSFSVKSICC